MKCTSHLLGLIWECRTPEECSDGSAEPTVRNSVLDDRNLPSEGNFQGEEETEEVEARTYKDDSNLRDQQSTGRKRAAAKFPLDETAPCEWSMKKNCGGGKFPITGCVTGLQMARHHGPDKNTLNNDEGNVHRICATCHNRWHTLNDEGYDWTAVHEPHSPREATVIDISDSEEFWQGRRLVKAKD